MKNSAQHQGRKLTLVSSAATAVLKIAIVFALAGVVTQSAQAQTLTVLHALSASEGQGLLNGLVADRSGNLYGTGSWGGINNCPSSDPGCGTVFKLTRHGSGWIFSVLYRFTGVADGWWPLTIAIGPDGSLYGTTIFGGSVNNCFPGWGCGTVFRLQPPPSFCRSVTCPWIKTTLFEFGQTLDGAEPSQTVTFDQAGNIYGATGRYGQYDGGTVWELAHSNGGWTFNVLYNLQTVVGETGLGVAFDAAGNLWDAGYGGHLNCGDPYQPYYCGVIWELTPSGSGWNQNIVYSFSNTTGGSPSSNFIFDQAGNLYGTVADNGPEGNGGVFQFSPSSGQYDLIYAAPGNVNVAYGPQGTPAMDQAGNLYAADPSNGAYDGGYVFKLTPMNGNWIYTDLHDFASGSDGAAPYGPLAVDANGNVYGANADNVIFEITP